MIERVALAVLSGVLLFASFPPLDAGWLAWIALTPLVLAVHGRPMRQAFGLGYLAGGVAFGGILAWIRVFGLLPWVLLTAYLALYPAAFAVITRWFAAGRPVWRWIWFAAIAWTSLEYLRSTGIFGFPWALVGLTQHRSLPILQAARYAGVYGVSFLVALVGTSLAGAALIRRPAPVIIPALLLMLATGWGIGQVHAVPAGMLVTAAVQPSVPQAQKFDPTFVADHMQSLQRLVANAGRRGAELIVLPETALPLNLFGPGGALVEVGRWAHQARATVVASSLENGASNIAVAVAPSGMAVSRYDKVRLVAFGETGILPGARHEPLWTPVGQVGVAICFESIFPDVTRALVRNGAQVLAVMTNDAWFDGTAGPAQHAAHAVLRAVESGRWVVRAANTGLSMVIDPAGRVRGTLSPRQSGVLTSRIGLADTPTVYAMRGDAFVWVGLAVLLVAAAEDLTRAFARHWSQPAFQYVLSAAGLPWFAAIILLRTHAPWWVLPAVLFGFLGASSLLQPPRHSISSARGHRARGRGVQMFSALVGGSVVVVGLWSLTVAAFRASGVMLPTPHPPGGWLVVGTRQLLVAAAIEFWLRGTAFAPLVEWQGPVAAVVVTTALGMFLQIGMPPEAYAWALVTGAAFGLIRARTGNSAGLVIPHAIGNMLFSAIAAVR